MDLLGKKSSLMPTQEYLLQGSVFDAHLDALLHRLNGLCDNVQTERFTDHEMTFQIRGTGAPLNLRVRRALDEQYSDAPWHIRYIGFPEVGDKLRHTLVRSCVDVGTSDNVVQFLQELGFRLDHELVAKGYLFRKGRMKVIVSKIHKMPQQGVTDVIEAISASHLVELSVVANQGQDQIQDDMKNFAEQLKPLVQLEKVDHRRLQQLSQ